MTSIEKYIARQTFTGPIFSEPVHSHLGLVVTIPAYAEENLIASLESLKECHHPPVGVEVVVIINHPENCSEELKLQNESIYTKAKLWAQKESTNEIKFLISEPFSLPKKHAGAGLARKIAMDEAVRRLGQSELENPIIAAFDGDATCQKNYLVSLYTHFQSHPKSLGCAIYFEHPLGVGETDFNKESIIQYELHLRYYQAAMVYANHPYSSFTVGSSMAVTRDAYVLQGGMNRRKAGEDFWFMLKLLMAGEVTDLTKTTVYPSSRESFRVPFGTGRSMTEMHEKKDYTFYTSRFESFERLKLFLSQAHELYKNDIQIQDELTLKFLESQKWKEVIAEIRLYTTDLDSFIKRFYRWFNSFMVMKFFHFMRDEGELDEPVLEASNKLIRRLAGVSTQPDRSTYEMLILFRHKKSVQHSDYTLS